MGKPDGLCKCLVEEKPALDDHFFDKGQLLERKNDHDREEEDVEDVELEETNVVAWEKKNGL